MSAPQPASAQASPSGNYIGVYRVVRELGRGGMGVVFLAMRDDGAFRKNVALKVLLREHVNQEFVLRFKQERQVLAALDHPNIARILDGGDAADGMPYYVMEYVEGMPLDQYCDAQRLSLTARIKLFQQVCTAVHYLHQNSILHRDLKPSNILVSNDGIVKLLDFGIAKLVGAASMSGPELTSIQGTPMTPTYASPEQIGGATLQKTSDIYSLGAILYVLLTGRSPYQGLDDKMAKLAAREDPAPPSRNIREDLQSSETTSQLRRAMMGEIDSIVLKTMRFDPKTRYQTATELADDLQHFLDGTPVTAHHTNVAGRSVRMLKRQRAAIAVLIGFLLLGGFGGWQWWRVQTQKREIAARESQLRSVLEQLEGQLDKPSPADQPVADQIASVKKLQKLVETDFSALAAREPGQSPARDALLARGVHYLDRVSSTTPADPDLNREVGDAYRQLGLLQQKTAAQTPANRAAALSTYQKAASALTAAASANPSDIRARDRLAAVNTQIQALGGSVASANPAPTPVPVEPTPAPPEPGALTAGGSTTQVRPIKPSQPVDVKPVEPPPTLPDMPAGPPRPSAQQMAEYEDRLASASSKVQIAEQSIEPVRQSLASSGQTLNPDTASAMIRMRSSLERAKREIAAGNYAGAMDSLAAADALATKVLRTVGR